jgi:hypothetical protein
LDQLRALVRAEVGVFGLSRLCLGLIFLRQKLVEHLAAGGFHAGVERLGAGV